MQETERLKRESIITSDQDAVVCEVEIAAPPARVWEALTTSDQLERWWHCADDSHLKSWEIDARAGGEWQCASVKPSGNLLKGKILEFVPPRHLVMTWEANYHAIPWKRTLVAWELIPIAGGTRVTVTHSGLKDLPADRKDYAGGWPGVLAQLKNYVER